jgi:ribokinase
MRVAVVGHVEWVEFLRVDRAVQPGAVLRCAVGFGEAAGGGGVAAAELARLAGRCEFYTAVGQDEVGRAVAPALGALGVEVLAEVRALPHRRATTLIDPEGERTIIVVGPAQAPLGEELPDFDGVDAVYFCKGDAAALRAARAARTLVATARVLPIIREAGVRIDALVRSANDPAECYQPSDLAIAPALVATTDGANGGRWQSADRAGRWAAATLPGPARDAYGAGDSFAAALTYALAKGEPVQSALDFAATRGAAAVCRVGAHGGPA